MSDHRYVVLTLEDAHLVAGALARTRAHRGLLGPGGTGELTDEESGRLGCIYDRLVRETGADMQEIVDIIKALPVCSECLHRGCASYCNVLDAQKQGRRLRRLLERARGERPPPAAQASRHIYAPSIGAASAEDLCGDHADEALREDGGRYEVTAAPPGRQCSRCAERIERLSYLARPRPEHELPPDNFEFTEEREARHRRNRERSRR